MTKETVKRCNVLAIIIHWLFRAKLDRIMDNSLKYNYSVAFWGQITEKSLITDWVEK